MTDSPLYDVAVIGAGPAGTSAAYTAAKSGLSTLLLEEHPRVGEPVHCGECLSGVALKRMGLHLPEEVIACRVKGIRVLFPDKTATLWREEGYVLDKHLFEQFLAVRAQGAGAMLKTGARVNGMKRENGIWTISTTNPSISFRARAVIDASGYEAVSTKLTGLNEKKFSMVSGAQYHMEDVPNDGFIDFLLWPRLAPHGYLWIIPKRNGSANVGLVTDDFRNTHKYLKQFVSEWGLEGKKIIKPFGGMIPCSGPLPHIYSDGLLLAGDAAGFTSPMFEGGTQLALKSGELAAQTLARAKSGVPKPEAEDVETAVDEKGQASYRSGFHPTPSGDPFSAHALSEYEHLCREEFPPYEKLLRGKRKMYAFSDAELNAIGRMLPSELVGLGGLGKAAIAAKALARFGSKVFDVRDALDTFSYSVGEKYGW